MDQSKDILELSQTFKIDLDHVPYIGKSSEKKKVARRRWAILAKALKVYYVLQCGFSTLLSLMYDTVFDMLS